MWAGKSHALQSCGSSGNTKAGICKYSEPCNRLSGDGRQGQSPGGRPFSPPCGHFSHQKRRSPAPGTRSPRPAGRIPVPEGYRHVHFACSPAGIFTNCQGILLFLREYLQIVGEYRHFRGEYLPISEEKAQKNRGSMLATPVDCKKPR